MNINMLSRRACSSIIPKKAALLLALGLVALAAGSAQAEVSTWTGDAAASGNTVGDWYTTSPGNWSGDVAPSFSNTNDIKIAGTQDLDQYIRQYITIKSLEFTSSNVGATQIGLVAANSTVARDLTFSADSGNSTLTVDALASGDKTLGTKGGSLSPGGVILESDLDIIHNGSGSLIFAKGIEGGSQNITLTGSGTTVFSGTNTYTGNTTVNSTLMVSDDAQLAFTISTNGVNNMLSGSGAVSLDGDFLLDLTGAGRTLGDSWQLVDVDTLTETFGATFSVASTAGSFMETNGVWSITENGVDFEFAENTGQLTVISALPVAYWLSGEYGIGWRFKPEGMNDIANFDLDTLVTQVQTISNVNHVVINLSDPAGGSQFLSPHPVLSNLDTQLVDSVFILNERDLFAEALTEFKDAGYKVLVYYASQGPALLKHGVEKAYDKVSDGNGGYTSASMDVWSNYVYGVYDIGDFADEREMYKTAHAEIILEEYAERYGTQIDGWWFDNGIENYNAPLQYAIAKKYNPNTVVFSSSDPSTENDAVNGHPTPLTQYPASHDINLPMVTNVELSDGGYYYTGDHPSLAHLFMAMGTAWNAGDIVWDVDKAADWIARTLSAGGAWTWNLDVTDADSILRADMVAFALDVQNKLEENKTNAAPVFTTVPIIGGNATQDVAYAGSIFGSAIDGDGDPLSYIKLAGPEWLSVSTNGVLSGTPGTGSAGLNSFQVGAVDGKGHNTIATLEIAVDPPVTLLQFDNLRGLIGTTPTINGANITDPNVSITKATDGNDVVYAMSIINQDLDGGGTFTDSLSWDIRVKGYTGGSAITNGNDSSVTLGSSVLVGTTNNEFGVSGTDTRFINAGESIQFSVENIVLTADAGLSAQFDGFSGLWGTAGSYIYGVGAGGLESQSTTNNGELTFAPNPILTVTSVENIERIRDLDGSFTVSAAEPPVPETGFAAWITGFGLSGDDLLPETDVEPDGLDNLLEYALGGNPTNDDAAVVLPDGFVAEDTGTDYLYYVHNQRTDDSNLVYTVGTKTNLVTDTLLNTNDVSYVSESGEVDSIKSVTNRTSTTEAAKFIQLKVEH